MQNNMNQPAPSNLGPFFGMALAAMMVVAIGGYAVRTLSTESGEGDCYEQELPPGEQSAQKLADWKKPLVTLVLSGQMHGYYDPCGCSSPQFGGLPRRFNFIQSLKAKNWDVVGIDLGELASLKGIHEQNLLKFDLSVKALAAMNYRAFGIGADETLLPLGEGLAQIWDKKRDLPRPLNLSLAKAAPGEQYHGLNARHHEIIADTKPRIGVINMMGPDLREDLSKQEAFLKSLDALPKALDEFAEKGVEIGIILHHEYPDVKGIAPGIAQQMQIDKKRRDQALKIAEFCADYRKTKNKKAPAIQLMMVLTAEPEPPSFMSRLDDKLPTQIVEIGHKGKYVGVVGVYKNPKEKAYRLQYQLVLMSPELENKKGQEHDNKVVGLLEDYNKELKRQDMLAKYQRTLHFNQIPPHGVGGLKATFVGSDVCSRCHNDASIIWEKTAHFKATETLEDPDKKRPPFGRQYDPECMMCHTTGFKHPGGYYDLVTDLPNWPKKPKDAPAAKNVKKHNDLLRGVGCESCHGPGSEHVRLEDRKEKGREALYPLINPYRLTKEERALEEKADAKKITAEEKAELGRLFNTRMRPMGQNLCIKCHDMENDTHWGQPGKDTADKWKGLIHRKDKGANGGAAPPAKENDPPAARIDPPVVIEVIQDKKK